MSTSLLSLYEMYKFDAEDFFWLASLLQLTSEESQSHNGKLSDGHRKEFNENLKGADKYCAGLELTQSAKQVARCLQQFNGSGCTYEDVSRLIGDLQFRIGDELDDRLFLRILSEKAKFYDKAKDEFGKTIISGFPSIEFDVEESGKCFATGRDTACVFHVMRIMEASLKVVATSLRIDILSNRSWDSMLKKMEAAVEEQHKRDEWTDFYSEAIAKGYAVKDAWRNPTMHVGKKYTSDEAEDIFRAVRGFMRHLSTKLSEIAAPP